ncbi:hypothetical protein Tco_0633336 [Tanacetum coccineum]
MVVSEKFDNTPAHDTAGNSMARVNAVSITTSRMTNCSSPKRVHFINTITIIRQEDDDRKIIVKTKEKESEESEEEVDEEAEEEEEDDPEYFDTFPTIEELGYHEWLLKNPRPLWVNAKDTTFRHNRNDNDQEKTHYSDSLNLGSAYRRDESVTKSIQCLIKMKSRTSNGGVT